MMLFKSFSLNFLLNLVFVSPVLAQAVPTATTQATAGGTLPEAGTAQPVIILTILGLALLILGLLRFFAAFRKN